MMMGRYLVQKALLSGLRATTGLTGAALFAALLTGVPVAHAQQAPAAETPAIVDDVMAAETDTRTAPRPPATAEARALQAAIENAGSVPEAVRAFYAERAYEPIWSNNRRSVLAQTLSSADKHGLPADRYSIATPAGTDLQALADGELAATKAYLAYAGDLSAGILEPRSVDSELHVFPTRPDDATLLTTIADATDLPKALAGLAPSHPSYAALMAEKSRLEALIDDTGWGAPLPSRSVIRPGATAQIVIAIRTRLEKLTDVPFGDSPVYDPALVLAIKGFQESRGLAADGVIGPNTFGALNATPHQKLRQVLVALERQRWLNQPRGARHIMVNQADFMATVYDNGVPSFTTRVVVGKTAKHRTPEFNDEMDHLVVNPTWHVPRSIATEEMLPKLRRNNRALGGSMRVYTRNGTAVNPALINFANFNKSNFPFVIKQRPGTRNALGRVKFMFPNRFNIYLHDTPSKSLFNRETRAFSHGCVRVQRPFELAHLLLDPQLDNPESTFKAWLGTGRERRVNLETPVPIYLSYQTAVVEQDGSVRYRNDVYGRDAKIFEALKRMGVVMPVAEG